MPPLRPENADEFFFRGVTDPTDPVFDIYKDWAMEHGTDAVLLIPQLLTAHTLLETTVRGLLNDQDWKRILPTLVRQERTISTENYDYHGIREETQHQHGSEYSRQTSLEVRSEADVHDISIRFDTNSTQYLFQGPHGDMTVVLSQGRAELHNANPERMATWIAELQRWVVDIQQYIDGQERLMIAPSAEPTGAEHSARFNILAMLHNIGQTVWRLLGRGR